MNITINFRSKTILILVLYYNSFYTTQKNLNSDVFYSSKLQMSSVLSEAEIFLKERYDFDDKLLESNDVCYVVGKETETQKRYLISVFSNYGSSSHYLSFLRKYASLSSSHKLPFTATVVFYAYESNFTVIVNEFPCFGSLKSYIAKSGTLSEREARDILLCSISSIESLRSSIGELNVYFMFSNIFLADTTNVVVYPTVLYPIDSMEFDDQTYYTPESVFDNGLGENSIVWGLGVVLYTILVSKQPYPAYHGDSSAFVEMLSNSYDVPTYFSEKLSDLISQMLEADPGRRLTWEGLKQHSWFSSDDEVARKNSPLSIRELRFSSYGGRELADLGPLELELLSSRRRRKSWSSGSKFNIIHRPNRP